MGTKQIEELTPSEVNYLIATKILGEDWDAAYDYCQNWAFGGPVVEKHLVGSEGCSAWVWYNGRNYGIVGNSQLDSCMKALLLSRYPLGSVYV